MSSEGARSSAPLVTYTVAHGGARGHPLLAALHGPQPDVARTMGVAQSTTIGALLASLDGSPIAARPMGVAQGTTIGALPVSPGRISDIRLPA